VEKPLISRVDDAVDIPSMYKKDDVPSVGLGKPARCDTTTGCEKRYKALL